MTIGVSADQSGRRCGSLLPAADGVRVVLWRHGQSVANVARLFQGHGDGPLTPTGHEQARVAADHLMALAPARIITSDRRRARDTAAALHARTDLPVLVDPRLREADLGAWEGRSRADIAARFPDEYARWSRGEDSARGCGERPSEVAARAGSARRACRRHGAAGHAGRDQPWWHNPRHRRQHALPGRSRLVRP
ncbi:histidine phosphatase family protein [Frankia sp. AiPa1]|uniref:histidine phosphatase family protein n=1 Tax=Frankia sp. AiPa1 TaxID=573492 RepID=UPI00202B1C89|nr:histidine phosphatase family protein [Frankia sp. AiPa1]MCL9761205.1 histidine phosphatase family protein [Frankia sp. AiPa1]